MKITIKKTRARPGFKIRLFIKTKRKIRVKKKQIKIKREKQKYKNNYYLK